MDFVQELTLLFAALLGMIVLALRLRTVTTQRDELQARLAAEDRLIERGSLAAARSLLRDLCRRVVSPVTVILAQCQLARARGDADPRLERIEQQARRIAGAVEGYRPLGAEEGDFAALDPRAVVRDVIAAAEPVAAERDIRLHELTESTMSVTSQPILVRHALLRLVRAAVEAAPHGRGNVTIACGLLPPRGPATHVGLAVADDGPGLSERQLKQALEPFPDGGPALRASGSPYGVVDALARGIGAVLILDSKPGEGTRATLKVPLAPPNPLHEARPATTALPAATTNS